MPPPCVLQNSVRPPAVPKSDRLGWLVGWLVRGMESIFFLRPSAPIDPSRFPDVWLIACLASSHSLSLSLFYLTLGLSGPQFNSQKTARKLAGKSSRKPAREEKVKFELIFKPLFFY